jgi:hypothetical protein
MKKLIVLATFCVLAGCGEKEEAFIEVIEDIVDIVKDDKDTGKEVGSLVANVVDLVKESECNGS